MAQQQHPAVVTLNLSSGGTSTGAFVLNAGTTLNIGGGTYNFNAGISLSGSGVLLVSATLIAAADVSITNLTLSGGTLTGPGNVTVSGQFSWTSGTMHGSGQTALAMGATGTISGTGSKSLGRVLANAGTLDYTGSNFSFGPVADTVGIINNTGVFDAIGGGGFTVNVTGAHAFNNAGTFNRSGPASTTTFSGVAFSNTGSVQLLSGTLQLSGSYTQTGGSTTLAGGTLSASGLVDIQAGILAGSGSINASVRNAGQINPGGTGAAGLLTINGNYTQTAMGVLNIEIGGTSAGTGYDQLRITGTATLGGTLNVSLINGFVPTSGATFQILTFGSRGGTTFATVNLDPVFLPLTYNAMDVTLTAN